MVDVTLHRLHLPHPGVRGGRRASPGKETSRRTLSGCMQLQPSSRSIKPLLPHIQIRLFRPSAHVVSAHPAGGCTWATARGPGGRHGKKLYEDKGRIGGGLLCTYILSIVLKPSSSQLPCWPFTSCAAASGSQAAALLVDPCPSTVDCYISKATEKMVFLYIMGTTSVLYARAEDVVEMVYILSKCWKCFSKRYVGRREISRSPSSLRPANCSPALQHTLKKDLIESQHLTTNGKPTPSREIAFLLILAY
ncbi:hypothetical protein DPEC_G00135000 [Dallia pectoralis]|uniref:Uncharacterized protein n=1 Tax=Dallia pectoralis TaxID=75939 RepID=A0ACC2GS47_DALPE|nr:hypothetical protein DPEC_G00135000 [Dallia pectoralis]